MDWTGPVLERRSRGLYLSPRFPFVYFKGKDSEEGATTRKGGPEGVRDKGELESGPRRLTFLVVARGSGARTVELLPIFRPDLHRRVSDPPDIPDPSLVWWGVLILYINP
ncbi:hypothetical protein MUK42_34277 [Musa troglodytarum]|uniref:Uncharacterized protein n=1 Tax=Musa troglodytarum TaxID=320322 RepID=A0A9E7JTN6_9LILI|nr:hypothetical protein MUK42_34277 [Musa troglodytarum]